MLVIVVCNDLTLTYVGVIVHLYVAKLVVVCRVPGANAPGYTAVCRLIVKPLVLDVPGVFHVTTTLETLAVKGGTVGREMAGNLVVSSDFHATLGILGPTALLPLRRKAC